MLLLKVLKVRGLRAMAVLALGVLCVGSSTGSTLTAGTCRTSTVSTVSTVSTLSTLSTPLNTFSASRAPLPSQTAATRFATTTEALLASPVFFHGKQVVLRHEVEAAGQLWRLAATGKPVYVFWQGAANVPRDAEIRGDFFDLGRLERNDSRFANLNLQAIVDADAHGSWPARDQVFMLTNAVAVESPLPAEPTIRALALAPEKYVGKGVTVNGRFRGANLFADLPTAAGTKGRWDFVLQSADAAIWITGVRPRGKGFDLDVNARMDGGRWLQVAGTLRREGPLPYIEATSVAEGKAPNEAVVEVVLPPPPPEAPPTVVFSAPLADETDAERALPIRIQFSRDMEPKSFANHVRVSYVGPAPAGAPPVPQMTVRYVEGTRALEIKPAAPLDRFRTVKVELLEGIVSNIDNVPLAPWSMTFTTGG